MFQIEGSNGRCFAEQQGSEHALLAQRAWFAVYTTPRHEKHIARHLELRQIEHFLPTYQSQRKWKNGLKVSVELPLFPSYIFVRVNRVGRGRILEVPGVLSIVGGRQPAPLVDFDIDSLRSGICLRTLEPHPYLVIGEAVRIKTGALAGMTGVLLRNKDNLRVVVSIDQIMRSVAVEVDITEIEPVGFAT